MLHFLTGMYYFTWFENLLIIIAGLSLGHFLHLIVRQVVAIRNRKSLTKIIRTMIPWLVLLFVLMLSPVFASGIAVGWMVIIGLLECVIEQVVITKFGSQLHQQRVGRHPVRQRTDRLVHQHSNDRPARSVDHLAAERVKHQSTESEHLNESNSSAEQAQSALSAVKPAASAAPQPVKSAASASSAEYQSPAVTNQAASTTATTESQPETSAPETSAPESHQPTSQEIMDHMFDFDPNVDYEAEAKAAAAEADKQSQEEDTHDKN